MRISELRIPSLVCSLFILAILPLLYIRAYRSSLLTLCRSHEGSVYKVYDQPMNINHVISSVVLTAGGIYLYLRSKRVKKDRKITKKTKEILLETVDWPIGAKTSLIISTSGRVSSMVSSFIISPQPYINIRFSNT